jgi:hypothetical protein
VTTPEPLNSQGFLQCAPGGQYSAAETDSFANGGTFDPHGRLGIYRYCETRLLTGLFATPTALTPVAVNDKDWPANSGFAHSRSFGPYTAAQDSNGAALGDDYGRETLQLVYSMGDGTAYILASQVIYLYPFSPAEASSSPPQATISNALTNAVLTPNVVTAFQGDPPRITVKMNNLYPTGTSWVVIYPGTPTSNSLAAGSVSIPNSSAIAPNNGLWTNRLPVTFDLANSTLINTTPSNIAHSYTIEAVQELPLAQYPNATPQILSFTSFSLKLSFNINGQINSGQ